MSLQRSPIVALILLHFLTSSTGAETILIKHVETLCALACHTTRQCSAYAFKDIKTFLSEANDTNWTGNCVLLGSPYLSPGVQATPLPPSFKQKYFASSKTDSSLHTLELPERSKFMGDPSSAGFDLSITVGLSKIFFKEIESHHTYDQAAMTCLENGGILPMESTDGFVDQVSILSGDSTTPRFISLAVEKFNDQRKIHLRWTMGQTEWIEGEGFSKCQRCLNWDFDVKGQNQWAKINPLTKMYELVIPTETVSKYYCQYVGGNLATHKSVLASTISASRFYAGLAVDGRARPGEWFWHAAQGTPGGEWISVNLGDTYRVTNVLFLGRLGSFSYWNTEPKVWVGGPEPESGQELDLSQRTLCGVFPFLQQEYQISGVACQYPIEGQVVSVVNGRENAMSSVMELAVHGFELL